MDKLKQKLNSLRVRLFLTLGMAVIIIIVVLILLNNVVLESFYLYSKQNSLKDIYTKINSYYKDAQTNMDIEKELANIAISNNFDILLKTDAGISIYTSNEDFLSTINDINDMASNQNVDRRDLLFARKNITIKRTKDSNTGIAYILLTGKLDNGYMLYIRIPISSIQESVKISNNFLYIIGGITIIVAAVIISFISKRFTEPITQLNEIAKKMANLDFSKKYQTTDVDDEINDLGKSINLMSEKLEATIKQLKTSNIELERDIEEKSKIDEMRKQFISDVSHELKTPIALIQGYAEGLVENVNQDEESKQFYADVILDEANKMDRLVKRLLELMKLEYGNREFKNKKFDVTELIEEVIRKSKVMLEEKQVSVKLQCDKPIWVYADDFYIEQVVTNYITNAIKHVEEIANEKAIEITISTYAEKQKVRVNVFNTGKTIGEEEMNRIWQRFYKIDTSRNREDGGTGIGLALVRAIMNNYHNVYGVLNRINGVVFFFELDLYQDKEGEK